MTWENLFPSSRRGYSSVVEHSTADREVPGSIPGAPCLCVMLLSHSAAAAATIVPPLPLIPSIRHHHHHHHHHHQLILCYMTWQLAVVCVCAS